VVCFLTHYRFNICIIISFHDLYHDSKKAINCAFFSWNTFFEITITMHNELSDIFFALKNFHDKQLPLHEKIARISWTSKKLHYNTFMTSLNQVVNVYKEDTINNVISLNIYENPSFCCTLFVFKNGTLKPWLNLKISSVKNSGLGVFSLKNSRRLNSLLAISVKLMKILSMRCILSRRLTGNP